MDTVSLKNQGFQLRKRREKRKGERERRRAVKRAQNASARSKHPVLKFLVTSVVVVLCGALALLVGSNDYHATAIGWVPFIMLVFAIVASWFYVRVLKRGISFEEDSDLRDCARDSEVHFTIHFHNKTPFFCFPVEPVFYISDMFGNNASEASTSITLTPFERYDLPFATRFSHIGKYQAGLDKIVLSDFLGLFTATLESGRTQSVLVTPHLREIAEIHFSSDAETESLQAAKSIIADSMDYAYVRDYTPGDPLKTIHWKLSSRKPDGGYYTRLFERYTNPGVAVFLDFTAPEDDAETLMAEYDAVVESGLSIAHYAQRRGFDTEVLFKNRYGETARLTTWRTDDMPKLIADMPQMSIDKDRRGETLDLINRETAGRQGENNVVVVSANITAETVSTLLGLKSRRRAPFMIAVVPRRLVESDLDKYVAPLRQLDGANIPYLVLSDSKQLEGAVL
ncbi:MAG: DUF58 domain-containing protein [Coriobacteriales bacterium]|jgi:uncharacterized protein (DUF58 family)